MPQGPRTRAARGSRRQLDGEHVLYHYLQKDLLHSDIWLFQMLAARLVVALGVWLAPAAYARLPILRPYAVRDPDARGNKARQLPDQWGSPTAAGLFRDDNSLIKRIPYSLPIRSLRNAHYAGRHIERGFVAAHVWRVIEGDVLASRDPLTYSFIPNLVWLPTQVAKLTDREGSFAQAYLQAISRKIYEPFPLSSPLRTLVEPIWARLPAPQGNPRRGSPSRGGSELL